jgi:hypothetical protein
MDFIRDMILALWYLKVPILGAMFIVGAAVAIDGFIDFIQTRNTNRK